MDCLSRILPSPVRSFLGLISLGFVFVVVLAGEGRPELLPGPEEPTWHEASGLREIERRWENLLTVHRDSFLVSPLTAAGAARPLELPDPALRFDLTAGLLGQSNHQTRQNPDMIPAFRPVGLLDDPLRWRVAGGFQVGLPGGFTLAQRTVVDSGRDLDPLARTDEYHQVEASVEVPLAALNFEHRGFTAWLGRRWENWGPGWTGSLIHDNSFPAADGWGLAWESRRWSARYRLGRIDNWTAEDLSLSRYLAAHRIDFSVGDSIRLGLSETALVATDGSLPLWMLNPLLPWVLAQQEGRDDEEQVNIMWAIDVIWNPGSKWALYGQFLLDDFMIDSEDRDTMPDQLGVLGGAIYRSAPAVAPVHWTAGVEYSRLWSWTYHHRQSSLTYRAWNGSPGHPGGPDGETVTAFLSRRRPGPWTAIMGWMRWHRQGRSWLGSPTDPTGGAGLPYPLPPVNRWFQLGAAVRFEPTSGLEIDARGGWTRPDITDTEPSGGLPPSHTNATRGWWASLGITLPLLWLTTSR